jgi:hypothetical protein
LALPPHLSKKLRVGSSVPSNAVAQFVFLQIKKKAFTTEYLYIKLALDFMNYNYALLFRLFHRWAARLLQLIFYKRKKKNHYASHKKKEGRKEKKPMFLTNITIKLKVLHT